MNHLPRLRKVLRISLISFGAIALFFIIIAFTPAPFWTWYRLSTKYAGISRPPDYIVVLGGGGMPSETGLIRCWYAAKAANFFPQARIFIALPGDTADSLSSVNGMKNELVLRGIRQERIFFEGSGTNTKAQALNIFKGILNIDQRSLNFERTPQTTEPRNHGTMEPRNHGDRPSNFVDQYSIFKSILIVTSPEHLYRAVRTFKKAGFMNVDGIPAFEEAIESDITFEGKRLGGRKWIPDIGENLTLRYQYWTQLHYEELLLREYCAIAYYWVKGWI